MRAGGPTHRAAVNCGGGCRDTSDPVRAAGADSCAWREPREPVIGPDQDVTWVLALGDRQNRQTRRQLSGEVFCGVDRKVGAAIEQRLLQLLDEESLARLGATRRAPPVTRRDDLEQLDLVPCGAQPARHPLGLCECKR